MKEFCLWEGYDYFHYNLVDYGFNDMMTSYVCGKNVAARFCSHLANENCQNGDASSGGGNTRNNSIEPNDQLTTLKLYAYDSIGGPGIATLYEHAYCKGR